MHRLRSCGAITLSWVRLLGQVGQYNLKTEGTDLDTKRPKSSGPINCV